MAVFLINGLIQRSSEYFLFFVDWLDNHIGRGGGHSDGCDWIRSRKVLSDFLKNVGGGQDRFQFTEK